MTVGGIIAEYNPFHTGHAHQLSLLRQAGVSHIAVVMSGSFVQRGEPAMFDKWCRAKAAVACGADLVVELPLTFAMASADRFALGGVALLQALGAESLWFGSECGSLKQLKEAGRLLREAEESEEFRRLLKEGLSYPAARAKAVEAAGHPEAADLLSQPNNLLGLCYLNAIRQLEAPIVPHTHPRKGPGHGAETPAEGIASASLIRQLGFPKAETFLPPAALPLYRAAIQEGQAPIRQELLETAVLWRLRRMTPADFAALPDVGEGLEHRLTGAAKTATSIEEFLFTVKTKRYTLARLRRILWYAMLELKKEDMTGLPGYIRVLAMNERGAEILRRIPKDGLPVGVNPTDLYALHPTGLALDFAATELAMLGAPKRGPAGADFLHGNPFIK